MYLIYFDENKFSKENPYFFIGGILVPSDKALELETTITQIQFNFFSTSVLRKETEFHGKDMFHGKGNFKKRKLVDRIQLFDDISTVILDAKLPLRFVCIDVIRHREKYKYPTPEYNLGLMLILEMFSEYLNDIDDIGVVFGDFEKDEVTGAILDFSEFKREGKTPMYYGRALGRLVDTIYFTQSHHSRFLQVADTVVYMAGRYLNMSSEPRSWHDKQVYEIWNKIVTDADIKIKRWP